MNLIQIFENNYVDTPTMDTRLTPKWAHKHPKQHTISLDHAQVIDYFLEEWQNLGTPHVYFGSTCAWI